MELKRELSSLETKEILRHMINNNIVLAEEGKKPVALSILGNAGIGKTSIVHQVVQEFDYHFIRLNLAEIVIDDLVGYPVKEYEYLDNKNNSIWINENLITYYVNKGFIPTHKNQMSYATPQWLTGKSDKPVILFLDDAGRANVNLMQATMTIIDEGKYISWSLPKGSTVILSNNPDNGDYLVTATDDAQKTRYLQVSMKFDLDSWLEWAESYGLEGKAINFIMKNPEVVQGIKDIDGDGNKIIKGNIRLWTKYFDTIGNIKDWKENLDLIMNLGGNLPEEHLLFFVQFVENKLDKLPQPKQLLDNAETWVLNELTSLIGKDESIRRQDLAAILIKRLVNYLVVNEKDMKSSDIERTAVILESELFSKDLVQLGMRKLVNTNKFKTLLPNNPKLLKFLMWK